MKKILIYIYIIVSVCACGNNVSSSEAIEEIVSSSEAIEEYKYGDWVIGDFINDFDEPTGEKFIRQVIFGDFSNSATSSRNLRVTVFIYKDRNGLEGEICFDEYADGVIEETIYNRWKPARYGSKIVDKTNRKVFFNDGEFSEFENREESKIYSWIDIFQVPSTYDVTIKGEYKTEYRFTINTDKMNLALKDAGIIFGGSTSLFQ